MFCLSFCCLQRDGVKTNEDNDTDDDITNDTEDNNSRYDVDEETRQQLFTQYLEDCNTVLGDLRQSWGVKTTTLSSSSQQPGKHVLSRPDGVLIMEGWNKALAFRSMFGESLIGRWRTLCAQDYLSQSESKNEDMSQLMGSRAITYDHLRQPSSSTNHQEQSVLRLLESNTDPIAKCFGSILCYLDIVIIAALDCAVRELCPHQQIVQREAYRPVQGSVDPDPRISQVFLHKDDCKTFDNFCSRFARHGLNPRYWYIFCEAFVWTMRESNPYVQEHEKEDLERPPSESAYAKFVAGNVVLPLIVAGLSRKRSVRTDIFQDLRKCCCKEKIVSCFGSMNLFPNFFKKVPQARDYFSDVVCEKITLEVVEILYAIVQDCDELFVPLSDLRDFLSELGVKWRELNVPLDIFILLSSEILDSVKPLFSTDSVLEKSQSRLQPALEEAMALLLKESLYFLMQPMVIDKKLRKDAKSFYEKVAAELNWSPQKFEKRMFEVNNEISATGQYTHSSEELEIGARLAWRNSAKCIGRIAWNTLKVRDRRHCSDPHDIFQEVVAHLKEASGGTSIQSVMTVFKAQQPDEMFGLRFWSSQFVRYAGYKDEEDPDKVLGDPANLEFTSYLIEHKLWTPPLKKTAFDILPVVVKVPSNDVPFVFQLPEEVVHEIIIEHPKYEGVKRLGLRWPAIPAISNFMMELGGIKYACAPFNGWFVSIEIARNLLERYHKTLPLARAMNIDPSDRMLAQKVSAELENAILHSFDKQEFTIVDPLTVGQSFISHCGRERAMGRECPAQWSWIGGLVGPTNPTWHSEMRDFYLSPQYDYCCSPWKVVDDGQQSKTKEITNSNITTESKNVSIPRVLIAYGSETGTAEDAAKNLSRLIKICKPQVMSLNSVLEEKVLDTQYYSHLLVICSTFGAGEPPQNAKKFFEQNFKSKSWKGISFGVLALGSSLYPDFCQAGKDIDRKISTTGAKRLMNVTCADATQGSHTAILKWSHLVKNLVLPDSLVAHIVTLGEEDTHVSYNIKWDGEHILESEVKDDGHLKCILNKELFVEGNISSRSTRHIELELPPSMTYTTGDHLSVYPVNETVMVHRFVKCFAYELGKISSVSREKVSTNEGCSDDLLWLMRRPFRVDCEENGKICPINLSHLMNTTLNDVLRYHIDLSFGQKSYFVELLSTLLKKIESNAGEEEDTNITKHQFVEKAQRALDEYNDFGKHDLVDDLVQNFPTIIHLFEEYQELFFLPWGKRTEPLIKIAEIIVMMPLMKPRFYSISSSNKCFPSTVSITVGVLNTSTTMGVLTPGVCSHYLAQLKTGDMVRASVIPSSFRLPMKEIYPLVMIGAGTGLAPFMGFLDDRNSMKNKAMSECHLFFGCRNKKEAIYAKKLAKMEKVGRLRMHLAHSREKNVPNQYVQHKVKENSKEIVRLLLADAHFYICGDAKMAKSVREVCVELLQSVGGLSRMSSLHHMMKMDVEKRWQLDVWGEINMEDVDDMRGSFSGEVKQMWTKKFRKSIVLYDKA